MIDHWLFFLDADGWLVGPESAPFPGEERALNAALTALRDEAPGLEPDAILRFDRHFESYETEPVVAARKQRFCNNSNNIQVDGTIMYGRETLCCPNRTSRYAIIGGWKMNALKRKSTGVRQRPCAE